MPHQPPFSPHEGPTHRRTTTKTDATHLDEREAPGRNQIASINNRMPKFPALCVVFSKVPSNMAHEVITFNTQVQFDHYRAMSVGAVRVVTQATDLADVPTPALLAIFNQTRADSPLDRFRDRETAERRTFDVLAQIATPYQESTMAKSEAAQATTKAEAKAQERKAAKEAKKQKTEAEKAAAAAALAEKRAGGVIGTIKLMIDSDTGATHDEILKALTAKFPDRSADGMLSTVKIQSSRLAKSTGREIVNKVIVDRGRVYKFADRGPIPGVEVVEAAPAAETPAEPKAKKGGKEEKAAAAAEA